MGTSQLWGEPERAPIIAKWLPAMPIKDNFTFYVHEYIHRTGICVRHQLFQLLFASIHSK